MRVLWTARIANESILEEINPEHSLKVLILKMKLQCFGHLIQQANSLEKIVILERLKVKGQGGHQE